MASLTNCAVLVLFAVSYGVTSASPMCPYKVCQCHDVTIDCAGLNLQTLPPVASDASNTSFSLDLSVNNISSIGDSELPQNLKEFISSYNPLTYISSNAFSASRDTMTSISIRQSQFRYFPEAFKHLLNLTSLSITLSNLSHLSFTDDQYPLLESLDLSFNEIADVSAMTSLQSSGYLTRLDLNHNLISDVSGLANMTSLRHLGLLGNKLTNATHVTQVVISLAASLEVLDLSYNSLEDIPHLTKMSRLETFFMSHNNITDFDAASLPPNLKGLFLNHNRLVAMPTAVCDLPRLETVYLANNFITNIDNVMLPSSVTSLNLQNNRFTKVTGVKCVNNTCQLDSLSLAGNPLQHIDAGAFDSLVELTSLDLSRTALVNLPAALRALPQLSTLDLRDIADLQCTCGMSAALLPWYQNMTSLSVRGKCAGTEVAFFLDQLAPLCPVN